LVAVLELLDLTGQQRDRLLQLVEPILDIDRVGSLCDRRRRQGERDEDQESCGKHLHGNR